jgi:hypothetical protein
MCEVHGACEGGEGLVVELQGLATTGSVLRDRLSSYSPDLHIQCAHSLVSMFSSPWSEQAGGFRPWSIFIAPHASKVDATLLL